MKRALAERAKQSGLPNGAGPSEPDVGESLLQPDIENGGDSDLSMVLTSTPTSGGLSVRHKKRLREAVVKLEEEDEDDSNANAFYLRHQNRALSSELRQMKYQLRRLEHEREIRRLQCTRAVQNLNTLNVIWSQLEDALKHRHASSVENTDMIPEGSSSAPPLSTGSGSSVEMVGALFHSLASLGVNGVTRIKSSGDDTMDDTDSEEDDIQLPEPLSAGQEEDDDGDDEHVHHEALSTLMRITDKITSRANTLQGWILTLLQRMDSGVTTETSGLSGQVHAAQQKVARLKAKNKTLNAQIQELARSRDELHESDRRVRRGLYRLASNRVQLKEVLKAIVSSDEDKDAAAEWMEFGGGRTMSTPVANPASVTANSEATGVKQPPVSSEEVARLQKKILDLEQVASSRDDQIKTLLMEREEQTKKISGLMLSQDGKSAGVATEQGIKNSDLYAELSTKLKAAERQIDELKEKEQRIKVEWGQALATAEAAQKEIEDLNVKHVKRWTDLVEEYPEMSAKVETQAEDTENNAQAKEIVILQHKLTQALENVRQAEGTRKTLQEAVLLNNSLQAKVEDIKSKFAELQNSKSEDAGDDVVDDLDDLLSSPKPKTQGSSVGATGKVDKLDKSSEKLSRDYRRLQKQLTALTESREKAKAKLERAEKERDALQGANSRLLRQAAEKDEMNAKSLSTILHLKQLTDQITKEKENLEQQVKSSQQLALSARLAANARERLSEEVERERQSMEARIKEWEVKCQALAAEKDQIEVKMTQNRSRMASLLSEVEGAKNRCEELASESTKLQEEKQKMMESLAIAHNDAEEARNQTEQLSRASGGAIVAGFTAEQLHTQVKHLQSRVNCPVCNARDKKCILLRCRHMFCKNCVDETIKNRSRKCPACGIRFDTKDVGDIWL